MQALYGLLISVCVGSTTENLLFPKGRFIGFEGLTLYALWRLNCATPGVSGYGLISVSVRRTGNNVVLQTISLCS